LLAPAHPACSSTKDSESILLEQAGCASAESPRLAATHSPSPMAGEQAGCAGAVESSGKLSGATGCVGAPVVMAGAEDVKLSLLAPTHPASVSTEDSGSSLFGVEQAGCTSAQSPRLGATHSPSLMAGEQARFAEQARCAGAVKPSGKWSGAIGCVGARVIVEGAEDVGSVLLAPAHPASSSAEDSGSILLGVKQAACAGAAESSGKWSVATGRVGAPAVVAGAEDVMFILSAPAYPASLSMEELGFILLGVEQAGCARAAESSERWSGATVARGLSFPPSPDLGEGKAAEF